MSTNNIAKEPAMSYDEAVKAILIGADTAIEAADNGYLLIGAGEMGIANTTTSAAVLCALTGLSADKAAGKGAGLSRAAYEHKVEVVSLAIAKNKPNKDDAIDVLAKVGGFDIAALVGVYLGCAVRRIPVVIDGFISMVAALAAVRISPMVKGYMIASHASFEQGFIHAADAVGLEPCLNLNMRLGEGSGCPIMFSVIDAACDVIKNMATFEEAEINDEYIEQLRQGDKFTV
jgi:nicotinate-nucleotide--dimethylbenzimidazole phosphoribosyltransferase